MTLFRTALSHLGISRAIALGVVCTACAPSKPTEIVAGVSTQIRVPDDLKAIGISIHIGGKVEFCDQYPVTDGAVTLPATLGVLESAKVENAGSVTITVAGERKDEAYCNAAQLPKNAFVIRSRRVTFVDDEIKFLPIPLKESCADVVCDTDKNLTCIAGKCVGADVDGATLQTYSDNLLFGNSNTCFDAETCMSKAVTLPVVEENHEDCTFRVMIPKGSDIDDLSQINVRVFYKTMGTEILDLDSDSVKDDEQEGFSLSGGAKTARFRLAPNLCETAYKGDKILNMEAAVGCPAKRPLQPLCTGYEAPQLFDEALFRDDKGGSNSNGGGSGSGKSGSKKGNSTSGYCTIAGLQPVDSAVYVLMDNGYSMGKFFGPGGLKFAIELPLRSPVAKHTQISFGLLPAVDTCGAVVTDAWAADPSPVDTVRDSIGAILGDPNTTRVDDPPVYLDSALQAAYAKLASVAPRDSDSFNRRAVIVVANRDTLDKECADADAVSLAALHSMDNFDRRIYTYAIALGNDIEDEGDSQAQANEALRSAHSLALAGGTSEFNGVNDESEGARAVSDILTELGTCLYKVNRADTSDARLSTSTRITYIDPSVFPRAAVSIGHNAECKEKSPTDSSDSVSDWGWNYEGNSSYLRLCGVDCDNLRKAIGDVSVAQAAEAAKTGDENSSAPSVPLVAAAPCDEFNIE